MMKKLALAACILAGCAHNVPASNTVAATPAPVAAPVEPAPLPRNLDVPVVVAHDAWSVTIPPHWHYDDDRVPNDKLTQVLYATSDDDVGTRPVQFSLQTVDFPGGERLFAAIVNRSAPTFIEGSHVEREGLTAVDDHLASLTLLTTEDPPAVVAILGVAIDGTGYVLACTGDSSADERVSRACVKVMKSFHVQE